MPTLYEQELREIARLIMLIEIAPVSILAGWALLYYERAKTAAEKIRKEVKETYKELADSEGSPNLLGALMPVGKIAWADSIPWLPAALIALGFAAVTFQPVLYLQFNGYESWLTSFVGIQLAVFCGTWIGVCYLIVRCTPSAEETSVKEDKV